MTFRFYCFEQWCSNNKFQSKCHRILKRRKKKLKLFFERIIPFKPLTVLHFNNCYFLLTSIEKCALIIFYLKNC